jgi:hypothetical protein
MKMSNSNIPSKKHVLKDKYGNTYKILLYEYEGENNLDTSYLIVRDNLLPEFADYEVFSFIDCEKRFRNFSSKSFARLIEKYDESYEEAEISKIENYDETERLLTKADWERMLENLDMPREKHESRPVVCNNGLLCFNAATGCRVVGISPKRGDDLYKAVESKRKFKKQYWRYAEKSEIEAQILCMAN